MRLDALLAESRRTLGDAGIGEPGTDSRLLVCQLLRLDTAALIAGGDREVDAEQVKRVRAAVARRAGGEPVHRILGARAFRNLVLSLSPDTLEPRPDTEILVDLVLPHLRRMVRDGRAPRVLDLGTGTGAILLAILDEVPEATGLGVDISPGAIATAAGNAAAAGLDSRASFLVSDWFSAISPVFDVIVSNPPYIPTDDIADLSRDVRDHDPRAALDGGADGLDPYRLIARQAREHLAAGGLVAVEHGFDQREAICRLFTESGYNVAEAARDLGGRDRAILFKLQ